MKMINQTLPSVLLQHICLLTGSTVRRVVLEDFLATVLQCSDYFPKY